MSDTDYRAMVEAAYNEAESAGPDTADAGSAAQEGSVSSATDSSGPGLLGEQGQGAAAEPEESQSSTARTADAMRARDATGKFTKAIQAEAKAPREVTTTKTTAAPSVAKSSTSGTVPPAAGGDSSVAVPPSLRAPQSWKPEVREKHWGTLPPEVQAEVHRLEADLKRTLQDTSQERRFAQEAQRAFTPYAQFAQSIGSTPLALAQQASQVAMQISTAPAHTAAQVLANLVRSRPDISMEMFAQALDSQPQAQQNGHAPMDARAIAAQVRQEVLNDIASQRSQVANQGAAKMVESFATDAKNEFFEDVWPEMAGLIDAHKLRTGAQLSLEEAYEQAVWSRKDLRGILQRRQSAEAAKASTASTQQAQLAASSVKSSPSTGASTVNGRAPQNHREMVAAAWDSLDGR